MNIFIAGKFTSRMRLLDRRQELRRRGHTVKCTWMDWPEGKVATPEEELQEALNDLVELGAAGMFIIDTLDESNTGGREVELGFALANNIETYRVGPVRNVYHHAIRGFGSWNELLDHFTERGLA